MKYFITEKNQSWISIQMNCEGNHMYLKKYAGRNNIYLETNDLIKQ